VPWRLLTRSALEVLPPRWHVFVHRDGVEPADSVRAHHCDQVHRALLAEQLRGFGERSRIHLAIVQQLAAEADDRGIFLVDAGERGVDRAAGVWSGRDVVCG
jgi:hypothetical protein